MKKKDLEKNLDLWIIEQKHDELAENTLNHIKMEYLNSSLGLKTVDIVMLIFQKTLQSNIKVIFVIYPIQSIQQTAG